MDELFEYSDSMNAPFQAFTGNWKTVKPHWHYFTEMIYLVSGSLYAEVDGRKYTMNPGDLIIFHPKQIHSFLDYPVKDAANQSAYFYAIKFDDMILSNTTPGSPKLPKLLNSDNQNNPPSNLLLADELKYDAVKLFFENCIWEVNHKEFGYDIKVASTISLIITTVFRIWLKHGFEFNTKSTFDQFSSKDFSVLEYIDAH